MEEQRRLLYNNNQSNNTDRNSDSEDEEEEWSDDVSEEESYYSDSDSSVPEWESSVHDTTGELFFVDCHPFVTQNTPETPPKPKEAPIPFSKTQLRRSTRGKFLRLIRRRESKRHSRRPLKPPDSDQPALTSNKVKFQDSQEGEEKEVVLKVAHDETLPVLGHKTSLAEILLGINISTLSDGTRVMIAGFLPDSSAKHEKNIKIGDWLKSIDDITVTFQNINAVLEKLLDRSEVKLNLQRVAGVEVTKDPPMNELNSQSRFVHEMVSFDSNNHHTLCEALIQLPLGVIFVNMDKLSETSPEFDDVIYCFPQPLQKSLLCCSRGIFITLNHLINDITNTQPKTSSFLYRETHLAHIVYNNFNNNLFLVMIPESCASVRESQLINNEILRMIRFVYENIERAFGSEKNKTELDHFFGRFFVRLLNKGTWTTYDNVFRSERSDESVTHFEDILPAAAMLHLPNEAHVQVDDALTELEASDYREWNEEPLDCQRLFTILGSALYHHGYLLASHLIYEDLVDVHTFCKQQGFFHLSRTEPVKTLVFWREVFPHSCNTSTTVKFPLGKRYLLIIGSRKDLLAVIMEAGGCTEPAEENMGPEAFYVEEVQATLSHIQELGVPELADRLIATNPGLQVTIPETCSKRKSDFIDTLSKSVALYSKEQKKQPEVTSILKRRSSDQARGFNSSFYDNEETYSEDSESRSEVSDEFSARKNENEESDTDEYGEGSQMSSSSFDISELRQSLLSEGEDVQPQQVSAGSENVLFHFVQFDASEGVLVCPPECRLESRVIAGVLESFRGACHKIHALFENTMRFKNMPAQDMAKSVMNKSLIAVKEHGVMFECSVIDDDAKRNRICYWVIGRLFYMPHPKEVYVCYQENIPQNIIELAFKIDLSRMN